MTRAPRGRILYAHVEQSQMRAEHAAEDYRGDRRNKGAWSVRTIKRTVRAEGVNVPCWVVIVRERFHACGSRSIEGYRCTKAAGHAPADPQHHTETHPLLPTWRDA